MNDVTDLADTIKPKSDQLNADDLLTGPITVTIVDVTRGPADQPVSIVINGHMPFKPCKTVRRVLVTAWGQNGKDWIGRQMTLFCDPTVKWGGVALGGIRVSHLSHIDSSMNMMLTQSRGKKAQVVIHPIQAIDHSAIIEKYTAADDTEKDEIWASIGNDQQIAINESFTKQATQ